MFFDHNLLIQRDECGVGTNFYTCNSNKFYGCCSKDPCALGWCPDNAASQATSGISATAVVTIQTTITTTTSSSTPSSTSQPIIPKFFQTSILPPAVSSQPSSTTLASSSISPSAPVPSSAPSTSATLIPSAQPETTIPPHDHTGNTVLISGILIAGGFIVGLFILIGLLLHRRRRLRRSSRDSATTLPDSPANTVKSNTSHWSSLLSRFSWSKDKESPDTLESFFDTPLGETKEGESFQQPQMLDSKEVSARTYLESEAIHELSGSEGKSR